MPDIKLHVVYKEMSEAMKRHPEVDVLINFASLRSAYESTMETMTYSQVGIYCLVFIVFFVVAVSMHVLF